MKKDLTKEIPKHTVLRTTRNEDYIDRLIEIYATSPETAKVFFEVKKDALKFKETRIVLFEYSNGDFRLASIQKSYGISKTNRIYNSSRNLSCIVYKAKDKKFYSQTRNGIKLLTYSHIISHTPVNGHWGIGDEGNVCVDFFTERYTWFSNLSDYFDLLYNISLNTIITKKLYNKKNIFRHVFKESYPVCQKLYEIGSSGRWNSVQTFLPTWIETRKALINIESITKEMYLDDIFMDTCKMANMLNKKINCSWGLKRLKQEHDDWNKQIIQAILKYEIDRPLNIGEQYRKFGEFSESYGIKLLETTHDLIHEGMAQSHCVGTYIGNVDNQSCAIYKYKNYTLELSYSKYNNRFNINQLRGFRNVDSSDEIKNEVRKIVAEFTKSKPEDVLVHSGIYDLPF